MKRTEPRKPMPRPTKPMGSCKKCDHRPHATACRSCACAYRTERKPIEQPRKAPPKKKPASKRAPSSKRQPAGTAKAWRERIRERAGGWCEMLSVFVTADDPTPRYYEHAGTGSDPAHIVRRHKCGDAKYHEDVAIWACRRCHQAYDSRDGSKDVREDARLRCFLVIRSAEVARIERGVKSVVPVDLSEILPAGPWTATNQYDLIDAARAECGTGGTPECELVA